MEKHHDNTAGTALAITAAILVLNAVYAAGFWLNVVDAAVTQVNNSLCG